MSTEEQGTLPMGTDEATPAAAPETTAAETIPEVSAETTPEVGDSEGQPVETAQSGTDEQVTAEEKQRGYMREDDYTRKTMELAETRKAVEARQAKLDQALEAGEILIKSLSLEFYNEFKDVNWEQLAADDPAQWALKQQRYISRQAQLQQAVNMHQQQKTQREQEKTAADQKRKADSYAELLKAVPEWKDPEKFAQADRELSAFLVKSGYTPEEIGDIADHRHVLLARDAMLYRQLMAKKPSSAPIPSAPAPVPPAATKSAGPKGFYPGMTDKEFNELRARQIAQRR